MFSAPSGRQSGNIVVYILIAIALFGALTLILMRQNDQSDGQTVSDEQLALHVNELIGFSSTAHNVIDQMVFAGSEIDDILFVKPTSGTAYNNAPHIHKFFHPMGGGVSLPATNPAIFRGTANNPVAGWYIGRFNNVQWTDSNKQEIILTAHQISQPLCAAINRKLTGSTAIPALAGTGNIQSYFISPAEHSVGSAALTETACAACKDKISLCVSNAGGTMWSFYTLIATQ